MKCTLVILFNHPYLDNIPKIKKLYGDKYEDIIFIAPIVKYPDANLISVYRGSFNFHGYVVDALDFIEKRGSDLYIFCHDDLIINPDLTPDVFWKTINFDMYDGFIAEPEAFYLDGKWPWTNRVISRLIEPMSSLYGSGLQSYSIYLPSKEKAEASFRRYGIDINPSLGPKTLSLPYPISITYADFFALRCDALRPVVHTLGVFAAMDLFVEVSVGTAMILRCQNLATIANTPWRVATDWRDRAEIMRDGPRNLNELYKMFDDKLLYHHPIKLSIVDM